MSIAGPECLPCGFSHEGDRDGTARLYRGVVKQMDETDERLDAAAADAERLAELEDAEEKEEDAPPPGPPSEGKKP